MFHNSFAGLPMNRLESSGTNSATAWLWHGLIAKGNLTLLTSLWKAGKTTMVTGLLQRLGAGGEFLGRSCVPAKVTVVSEESTELWIERLRLMPVGPHAQLVSRPFLTTPTPQQWNDLIDHAIDRHSAGELDFFVVDTLRKFLPGRSDSDAGTLMELLQPLQRLAAAGVAVLILHHPRKERSEEGNAARGSGALLGFVDIVLELHRFGLMKSDENRRRLIGLSRHTQTPKELAFEWNPDTGAFTHLTDMHELRYQDNWLQLNAVLARHDSAITHQDILNDWPPDRVKPSYGVLYDWLNRAFDLKLIRREGKGRRNDPLRYRLPNEDDEYWDRGELPPLKELPR